MDEANIQARMEQVLGLVRTDVGTIRTGRASPSLVENIEVPAYGGQQKLKIVELATITVESSQTLVISPWDQTVILEIKKAIEVANIGLTPVASGQVIRINLSPLTSEDRANYIKILGQKIESGRIMIRQIRHEIMEEIRSLFTQKQISEDEKILQEKRLQEITDEYVGKIDELGKAKEEELRSV